MPDVRRIGFTQLTDDVQDNSRQVNIIFVHGLRGHPRHTWEGSRSAADTDAEAATSRKRKSRFKAVFKSKPSPIQTEQCRQSSKIFWPEEYLIGDIPEAHVWTYGYDADTIGGLFQANNKNGVSQHGRDLAVKVEREVVKNEKPVVFVAHSLGGIIVKDAIHRSEPTRLRTKLIIFLGTPHRGSKYAGWAEIASNLVSIALQDSNKGIIKTLDVNSEILDNIHEEFTTTADSLRIKVHSFQEARGITGMKGLHNKVVDDFSSKLGLPRSLETVESINANHMQMVRCSEKSDEQYRAIVGILTKFVRDSRLEGQAGTQSTMVVTTTGNDQPPVGGTGPSEVQCDDFSLALSLSEVTAVNQFVARSEELAQLHDILGKADGRRTAILHGLGGMGKTQLAVAYVKSHHASYSATIWLNARDEMTLKQSFRRVTERISQQYPSLVYLKNSLKDQDLDQAVQAAKRWLDEPKNGNWLLVYDNYDDPKLGTQNKESPEAGMVELSINREDSVVKAYDIRQYFPSTFHGSILITTRSSVVDLGKQIKLEKLKDIHDSLEILVSTSHRQSLYTDDAAKKLAQKLDGLPLALSTAGAYLDQVTVSCDDYLQLYEESWSELQADTPQLLSYENRAMYSTWNISYSRIEREDGCSARLLRLWAYLDNNDIWYELLRAGGEDTDSWLQDLTSNRLRFNKAMRVLCSHGLAEADPPTKEQGPESRGYSVHECVHSWMANVLNQRVDTEMAHLALRCVASHVPNKDVAEYWWVQRRLLLHSDRCLKVMEAGQEDEADAWAFYALGNLFSAQGQLSEAEAMYDRALRGYEKIWGPEHAETLATVNNLGVLYKDQGRLSEAGAEFNRALRGYEKIWGPEHAETLDIVNNLGNLYLDQGQLSKAEAEFNRALRGYEKVWGPEDAETMDTVNNLGLLYQVQGRLSEAEAMYNRALRGKEKVWGTEHTSTLNTVNNLGLLYSDQGRLSEAEAMYNRALRGKEKVWGTEHTSTLNTVNNLGLLYQVQGRLGEAEAMYERALRGYEKAWGAWHISALDTVNDLGRLYHDQKRFDQAEAMYERALQGYETAMESSVQTYPPALTTLQNLGDLFCELNRPDEARIYLTRAEAGIRIVYGRESERYKTISSMLQSLD